MSLCLHGIVERETFSLRKSDMSEVCFLFGPYRGLFTWINMHRVRTEMILDNMKLDFEWHWKCFIAFGFQVIGLLQYLGFFEYSLKIPKVLIYIVLWLAFFSFVRNVDGTVLTQCNVTFPLFCAYHPL